MESVACNLCGSSQATVLYVLPDLLLDRREVLTTLVKCDQCGLIYQSPRPTLAEMSQHYPPEYDPYSGGFDAKTALVEAQPGRNLAQTAMGWFKRQVSTYGVARRVRAVTSFKSHGCLLDLGCGTGLFLSGFLNRPKWELHGVEPSEHAVRIARERYRLDVFQGTLDAAHFSSASFDVITLWEVLEHLHDPAGTLVEINRILKPEGILVIRVPNSASRDARHFGAHWAGLEPPRHLYVFSPQTLSRLLNQQGFDVIRQTSLAGGYTTYLLSLRFQMAARGLTSRDITLLHLLYHPVLRLISAPVFYFRCLGLQGPQLVVTAQKCTGILSPD